MGNTQTTENTVNKKQEKNIKMNDEEYEKYLKYLNNKKKDTEISATNPSLVKSQNSNNSKNPYYNNKKINSQIDSGVQDYQYFNSNIQYDRNTYQNFGLQSNNDPRFNQDPNQLLEQEITNRTNTVASQNTWGNNYNKIQQNFPKTRQKSQQNYTQPQQNYTQPQQNYTQPRQNYTQPVENIYYNNFTGKNTKQNQHLRIPTQQTSLNNINTDKYIPPDSSNSLSTLKDRFTKEEKLLMINNQITFYDIDPLGLLKTDRLTLRALLDKYLSLRKLYHPDKGGNTQQFILINNATKQMNFLQKGLNSDKQFNTLKKGYNKNMKNEVKNRPISFDSTKGFNAQKFNTFFKENRFNDENENTGYGHTMIPTSKKREDIEIKKKPTLEKNFNRGFLAHKRKVSKEVVRYNVPKAINNNINGFKSLGRTENNFSGYSKDLNYSDYKDAFDESNLINESEYTLNNKSLEDIKREREKGSLELSDIQKVAIEEFKNKKEQEEFERKDNFKKYQNAIKQHSEKVNSLLIR